MSAFHLGSFQADSISCDLAFPFPIFAHFFAGSHCNAPASDELHLYQLLSAAHAEHSKEWGSNLRINERTLKDPLSKGYFEAPGTEVLAGVSKQRC